MPEEIKDNGKLTDEQLLAISDIDIQDTKKYCDEDRNHRDELLNKQRIKRFNEAPETFIEISELICAAIRNPKSPLGISIWIGNAKRSEIDIAEIELVHRVSLARRQMDITSEMLKQGKIEPVKHGMFDFARKRK
jgi:hypothetical protein